MASEFLKIGYYKEENGSFQPGKLRAADIEATNGVTAEQHITNSGIHLTSTQAAEIAGAVQKAKLTAVITGQTISADGTSVTVTLDVYNAQTDTSAQVTRTIPLASASAAGVMSKEAYSAVEQLVADVQALKSGSGKYIGESFATKADLDLFVISGDIEAGDFTYVLVDETKGNATTRYSVVNEGTESIPDLKFKFEYPMPVAPVGLATMSVAGLVKGVSDTGNNGKIFIELDGTMSVIGWDDLLSSIVTKEGNQTINGVKTFGSEPVFPEKKTAPANDGTKPATEAQLYAVKQIAEEGGKLDAAFCEDEADMASKNLRDGAIVFMKV